LIANEYPDQEQRSCHRGLPWWVGGDLNLAFGLGFNVLVNVLVLTTLCVGVVQIPQSTVFGIILPALGIQLLFLGPYIRRYTPRAALLGTLAGISIAFISMRPAAQMWEALWIALPVFAIIMIGSLPAASSPATS